jgi:hypothetical protein
MADFQWKESHVKWFLSKFKTDPKELSAGVIEKRYYPGNGEPRKGKPKGDEQTIDMQDFRNLMRLMVKKKFARVTSGHVKSKGYRIRMVSDKYHYVQQLFSKNLLIVRGVTERMPDFDSLFKKHLPHFSSWNESHLEAWGRQPRRLAMYCGAFAVYNYMGGDFDDLFDFCPEHWTESTDRINEKEGFIIRISHFISMYKMLEIGRDEIVPHTRLDEVRKILEVTHLNIHEIFFIELLYSNIVANFLLVIESKNLSYSNRTVSNHFQLLNKRKAEGADWDEFLISLEKIFNVSDAANHYVADGNGCNLIYSLSKSTNQEVQKAVKEAKRTLADLEAFQVRVLNRSR